MDNALFETAIECSLTVLGRDIAKVAVFNDRLEFSKLKTQMDIPSQIMISRLRSARYLVTKYFDFKISLEYTSDGQEKTFDFVTCSDQAADWEGVSNPIKTFRLYRLLNKLIKEARTKE